MVLTRSMSRITQKATDDEKSVIGKFTEAEIRVGYGLPVENTADELRKADKAIRGKASYLYFNTKLDECLKNDPDFKLNIKFNDAVRAEFDSLSDEDLAPYMAQAKQLHAAEHAETLKSMADYLAERYPRYAALV